MRSGEQNLMTPDKQIAKQIAAEHSSAVLTPTACCANSQPKSARPRLRDSSAKPIFSLKLVRI
jgi:hypothetical protein